MGGRENQCFDAHIMAYFFYRVGVYFFFLLFLAQTVVSFIFFVVLEPKVENVGIYEHHSSSGSGPAASQ